MPILATAAGRRRNNYNLLAQGLRLIKHPRASGVVVVGELLKAEEKSEAKGRLLSGINTIYSSAL